MSRIYEALQRAELERKNTPEPRESQAAGDVLVTDINEHLPLTPAVDVSSVSRKPWTPSIVALPALAERGECVEQFRSLRSHLYLQRLQGGLKTILISSGMPAEGKTFIAANLVISLARNNEHRVLLIDADLRRSSLDKVFGAPSSPGLAEYLDGTADVVDIMQRPSAIQYDKDQTRDISNLTFIAAGACDDRSPELIGNHRIEELIARLAPEFDWIIIDAPPVLPVTDAVDLARAADAVLLVAREAKTPFDIAQRAQAAFSNSKVLGFVLNAVKDAPPVSSYYYYYGESDGTADAPKRRGKRRSRK